MKFTGKDIRYIYAAGDLHGMIETFVFKLHHQYKVRDAVVFCAGDIGLGFYRENYYLNQFAYLNKKLAAFGNTLLFVRGNHDDPAYWKTEKFNTSHILLVPDYTPVSVHGTTVLCIGGATSLDRTSRYEGINYWKDEKVVYEEESLNNIIADIVITHSAPLLCFPMGKENAAKWMLRDETLEADLKEERTILSRIYYKLIANGKHPSQWVYGNFHRSHKEMIGQTSFILLDEHEVCMLAQFNEVL